MQGLRPLPALTGRTSSLLLCLPNRCHVPRKRRSSRRRRKTLVEHSEFQPDRFLVDPSPAPDRLGGAFSSVDFPHGRNFIGFVASARCIGAFPWEDPGAASAFSSFKPQNLKLCDLRGPVAMVPDPRIMPPCAGDSPA